MPDAIRIISYPKTSGSTSLYFYIPLGAQYTYNEFQDFASKLVHIINRQLFEFTTVEHFIENRQVKMYLDFLQNRPEAPIAAPYSLRPKVGAIVFMPLRWYEVKPGLTMKDFTIINAVERLKAQGDLFKPALGKGIDPEESGMHLWVLIEVSCVDINPAFAYC